MTDPIETPAAPTFADIGLSAPVLRAIEEMGFAEPTPVHHVVIHWETAAADHYRLQVSSDGQTWQTALDVPDAPGGREVLELDWETPVRFVRMQGVANKYPGWGYSIWSFEIWNGPRPGVGLPAGDGLLMSSVRIGRCRSAGPVRRFGSIRRPITTSRSAASRPTSKPGSGRSP